MSKYEQLIEFIINEQEDKARELFHQIVVSKSREIYESLMDETDINGIMDEVEMDEEGMAEGEGEEDGMDLDLEVGGEEEEFGGEEHDESSVEDRVMDLESALDELKAEFDALMADEANEPEHNDGIDDPDFGGEEEMGDEEVMYEDSEEAEEEDAEEELEESKQGRKMTEAEWIREYVEKVNNGFPGNQGNPTGQNVGAETGDNERQGEKNTKSVVAGKNDMGGTTANTARGGAEVDPDGKQIEQPNNQYAKGKGQLKGAGQFKNVPGSKGDSFKSKAPAATKTEVAGTNDKSPLAK